LDHHIKIKRAPEFWKLAELFLCVRGEWRGEPAMSGKAGSKIFLHENMALAKTDKLFGVSLTRLFFMSIGIMDIHRRRGDLYGKRCGTWGTSSVHVLWIKEVKTWHEERG